MISRETKRNAEEVPELTAAERATVRKYLARSEAKPPVRFNVSNKAGVTVALEDPKKIGPALLMEALGSPDIEFANGIIKQLAEASSNGKEVSERDLNFLVSVIKGIEPRDQLEAMLAAQMAVIHVGSMSMARLRPQIQTIQQQDSWERGLNKLVRTFAIQMDALKRYRARGEQKLAPEDASAGQPSAENGPHAVSSGDEKVATSPARSSNETNVVAMPKLDKGKERTPAPVRGKPAA